VRRTTTNVNLEPKTETKCGHNATRLLPLTHHLRGARSNDAMSRTTVDRAIYGVTPYLHVRQRRHGVDRIVVRELPLQPRRRAPAIDPSVVVAVFVVDVDDVVDDDDDRRGGGDPRRTAGSAPRRNRATRRRRRRRRRHRRRRRPTTRRCHLLPRWSRRVFSPPSPRPTPSLCQELTG